MESDTPNGKIVNGNIKEIAVLRPCLHAHKTGVRSSSHANRWKRNEKRIFHDSADDEKPLNVYFEDVLHPAQRSIAVRATLEYLLYHRHQFPQPFAILSRQANRFRPEHRVKLTGKEMREERQLRTAFDFINSISEGLDYFFRYYSVTQVMLVLGSTVLSPKETFSISLFRSTDCHEGIDHIVPPAKLNRVSMRMGRELFSCSDLQKMNDSLTRTNSFVLVYASPNEERSVPPYFTPKQNLRLSNRGKRFEMTITEGSNPHNPKLESHGLDTHSGNGELLGDKCIWYQSAIPFKGYNT